MNDALLRAPRGLVEGVVKVHGWKFTTTVWKRRTER